jgi:hypothetical protein
MGFHLLTRFSLPIRPFSENWCAMPSEMIFSHSDMHQNSLEKLVKRFEEPIECQAVCLLSSNTCIFNVRLVFDFCVESLNR